MDMGKGIEVDMDDKDFELDLLDLDVVDSDLLDLDVWVSRLHLFDHELFRRMENVDFPTHLVVCSYLSIFLSVPLL